MFQIKGLHVFSDKVSQIFGKRYQSSLRVAVKVSLIYGIFSALWILLSDQVLYMLVRSPDVMTRIQMLKGWAFILVSTFIIFILLKREIKRNFELLLEFQGTFEQAAVGIAHVDLHTKRFIRVNQYFTILTGYPEKELLEKNFSDILLNNLNIVNLKTFNEKFSFFSEEFQFIRSDDVVVWCRTTISKIVSSSKNLPDYLVIVIKDISDQKKQEQRLRIKLKLNDFSSSATFDELIQALLKETERITNSKISFFHFVDSDKQEIKLQTWSENTLKNYCTTGEIEGYYLESKTGIWADCIRTEKPVIYNNYNELNGLPEGCPSLIRELVIPIIRGGETRAILGVGNKPDNYTQNDVRAVLELADMTLDIVLKKQVEIEKQDTEKKMKAIFNHRFQLTGLLDKDGKVLMANDTVSKMVGADSREIIGKYIWQLPHWRHSKKIRQKIRDGVELAQKGQATYFETTHLDLENNLRNIDFSLNPVNDNDGNTIYIIPEGIDVTEKKQSELKLLESERNYREIYNSSTDAIIIHDAVTGKIVDVNQTMLEVYGFTYEEALQLEIRDISAGNDIFTQEKAAEKLIKAVNEGPQLFEWLAKGKNGDCFWVEVALRNTEIGGKGRVLAVIRNITERKQLDSELRLVKHSIEFSAFPFYWIKKDGRFFYTNEAACQALGYSIEQLCRMTIQDIDLRYSNETWPKFWETIKQEKTLNFETQHCRSDGSFFQAEVYVSYLEFEGTEHAFAYAKDISDKIDFEKRKKSLEKQLQQAQKMEAIGTLAGGIAHDFNNILSSIVGFTELAQSETAKENDFRSYHNEILKAVERAKDLVNQILTFSRKQDQELKPLKAERIVKEALKLMRSSIPATIEIKSYIDPNCGLILADVTRFHQIIMNLCTNAYHSMKGKSGVINVNLRPYSIAKETLLAGDFLLAPGSYLRLEVEDTGRGIPEAIIDRVFEPYFTTKEKGEGTGLGLAIVHSIVEDFKGKLDIVSNVGKGTTLLVYFPVIKENIQGDPGLLKKSLLPGGNERILFVDDEKSLVEFNQIMLKSLGYHFTGFNQSKAALAAFNKSPYSYDLIITDMTMPGITGEKLAIEVLRVRQDIPIILCTGFSDSLLPERAEELGIKGYLTKPILKKDLANKIRDVLDD